MNLPLRVTEERISNCCFFSERKSTLYSARRQKIAFYFSDEPEDKEIMCFLWKHCQAMLFVGLDFPTTFLKGLFANSHVIWLLGSSGNILDIGKIQHSASWFTLQQRQKTCPLPVNLLLLSLHQSKVCFTFEVIDTCIFKSMDVSLSAWKRISTQDLQVLVLFKKI